jgi:hypothetical protein
VKQPHCRGAGRRSCDVGKTVHDFDFSKVSSDMLTCFLYQAVTATALCYLVQFVVCSKTVPIDRAMHSTMTSSWISN